MTLLLRAMRRLCPPTRNEVIVPSYTCYSVAASVVKAGLRIRIVDIDPATLGYAAPELESADFSRVLAIVATNLYGLPNDLPALARLARARGVFLIDDAAQAMGASIGGRPSGTWGDAGLFSFDKGKNVSAIDGGVVVVNSGALAEAMELETAGLPSPGISRAGVDIAKAIAYSVLLRPWLVLDPEQHPAAGAGEDGIRHRVSVDPAESALDRARPDHDEAARSGDRGARSERASTERETRALSRAPAHRTSRRRGAGLSSTACAGEIGTRQGYPPRRLQSSRCRRHRILPRLHCRDCRPRGIGRLNATGAGRSSGRRTDPDVAHAPLPLARRRGTYRQRRVDCGHGRAGDRRTGPCHPLRFPPAGGMIHTERLGAAAPKS